LADCAFPWLQLVCLDYLQRNTDRGLDNFMLRPYIDEATGESRVALGAIDNSLAFPHKHPVGIRSYPMGWLYLPVDLIGHPFAPATRTRLIPLLADPKWWSETIEGLRAIFSRDEMFDVKLFERQMNVMRGQGWNLLQALRNPAEGESTRVAAADAGRSSFPLVRRPAGAVRTPEARRQAGSAAPQRGRAGATLGHALSAAARWPADSHASSSHTAAAA
jgi:hypothetical protein